LLLLVVTGAGSGTVDMVVIACGRPLDKQSAGHFKVVSGSALVVFRAFRNVSVESVAPILLRLSNEIRMLLAISQSQISETTASSNASCF
jgi:hypothetical protein